MGKAIGRPPPPDDNTLMNTVESMMVFSQDTAGLVFVPFLIFFIFMSAEQLQVALKYDIRAGDFFFFFIMMVMLNVGKFPEDIIIHNTIELMWEWKLYEYLFERKFNMASREVRWKADELAGPELNVFPEPVRTIHQMCFSSQFFFMMVIHVIGIFCTVFGFAHLLRSGVNPFLDMMFPMCTAVVFLAAGLVEKFVIKEVLIRRGFWKPKKFTGTVEMPDRNQDVEDICALIRDVKEFPKEDLEQVLQSAIVQAAEQTDMDRGRVEKMSQRLDLGNLGALGVKGFEAFSDDAFILNPEWPEEFADGKIDEEEADKEKDIEIKEAEQRQRIEEQEEFEESDEEWPDELQF